MATPKLIVTSEQLRGTTFELSKDEMTIGRSAERDICLKDPTVSTLHSKVTKDENGFVLTDEGSTNGTRVNGEKLIGSYKLNSGDTISIGAFTLLYDSEDKTMRMSIHKTQTGININAGVAGTQTMKNMELSGFMENKQNNGITNKLILALVIILILIFLVLLAFFVMVISGHNPLAAVDSLASLNWIV